MVAALEAQVLRREIDARARDAERARPLGDVGFHLACDRLGDALLHGERIGRVAVHQLRPEIHPGRPVEQVDAHPDAAAGAADGPAHHERGRRLAPGLGIAIAVGLAHP